jgi:NAD(P)-dependent dehydrogenase (short-subunit alcohol dehydrogenase family)
VDLNLKNRIVVVTGGAAGIGAATVARFQAEGASVISWDVTSDPKIDVSNREQVEEAEANLYAGWFGRLRYFTGRVRASLRGR